MVCPSSTAFCVCISHVKLVVLLYVMCICWENWNRHAWQYIHIVQKEWHYGAVVSRVLHRILIDICDWISENPPLTHTMAKKVFRH